MYSTIHQILNLPEKGTAMSLGPVEVTAVFPPSQSKNGKSYKNIMVQDSSGKAKMALWESACNLTINKGDTISLLGSFKKNEFNGNVSIQTSDARFAQGAADTQPVGRDAGPSHPAPNANPNKLTISELAKQCALFTYELQEALAALEIKNDVIAEIVKSGPQIAALWWFGERSLKPDVDSTIEPDGDNPY